MNPDNPIEMRIGIRDIDKLVKLMTNSKSVISIYNVFIELL